MKWATVFSASSSMTTIELLWMMMALAISVLWSHCIFIMLATDVKTCALPRIGGWNFGTLLCGIWVVMLVNFCGLSFDGVVLIIDARNYGDGATNLACLSCAFVIRWMWRWRVGKTILIPLDSSLNSAQDSTLDCATTIDTLIKGWFDFFDGLVIVVSWGVSCTFLNVVIWRWRVG